MVKDRAKRLAYSRNYYKTHRVALLVKQSQSKRRRIYMKLYYEKHRNKLRIKARAYYASHRKASILKAREWQASHREHIQSYYLKKSKKCPCGEKIWMSSSKCNKCRKALNWLIGARGVKQNPIFTKIIGGKKCKIKLRKLQENHSQSLQIRRSRKQLFQSLRTARKGGRSK